MNPSRLPALSHAGAWSAEVAVDPPAVTTHAARADLPTLQWVRDLLVHESRWDMIDRARVESLKVDGRQARSIPGMDRETALVEIEVACALSRYLGQRFAEPEVEEAALVFSEERSALETSLRDQRRGKSRLETWRIDRLCSAWRKMSTAARTRHAMSGPVEAPLHPVDQRLRAFSAIVWSMGRKLDAIDGWPATQCLADLQKASDAFHGSDRLPPDQADRQRAMALQKSREVTDRWVAARKTALTQSKTSSRTSATTVPSGSLPRLTPTPRASRPPSLPAARRTQDQIYLPPIFSGTGTSSLSRAVPQASLIDDATMSLDRLLGLPEEAPARAERPAPPDALSICLRGHLPPGSMPRIAFELPLHGGQPYESPKDLLGDLQVARDYLRGPSVREHACGRALAALTQTVCKAVEWGEPPPVTALTGLLDTVRRASVCIDARQALIPMALQIEAYALRGGPDFQRDAVTFLSGLRDLDACMNEADGATVLGRNGRFMAEQRWCAIENRIEQLVRAGAAMLRREGGTTLARQAQWKTGSPDSRSSTPT